MKHRSWLIDQHKSIVGVKWVFKTTLKLDDTHQQESRCADRHLEGDIPIKFKWCKNVNKLKPKLRINLN